jgi:hypothetical protein
MSHDWEIDADISIRTLVFDITRQKRQSGRDVWPIGGRASVGEPTDERKHNHHDKEDFKKLTYETRFYADISPEVTGINGPIDFAAGSEQLSHSSPPASADLGLLGWRRTSARCPLYPQKRTLVERVGMSALCQKQTLRTAANIFVIRSPRAGE